MKSIKLRAIFAVVVCVIALLFLLPTISPDIPSFWKEKIHLGLDLQGGTHLVLEVDTAKAVESTVERMTNDLKEALMESRIRFRNIERKKDNTILLELAERTAKGSVEDLLKKRYPDLIISSAESQEGKELMTFALSEKRSTEIKKAAVEQSVETIRNRIDQFGVTEPEIIPEGQNRIIVQLPGIKDTQRAKNLIGKTALLEFKLVDEEHSLEEALKGNIPEDSYLAYGYGRSPETGQRTSIPYLLKSRTLLTGDAIETAQVKISDRFGEPYVAIKFNPQGAADFERITAENVKKKLAIILDGVVHSAPVIQERISGGQAQITGSFTMDEAKDLAIVLRAGALPAPVNILEERTVGPSLGQDSIKEGIWSIIIGGLLVVVFMVIYYNLSGFLANLALILNILIILGTLAAFRATLTLPGIAGILLTIGMAVDSNILIFERIREELRQGKPPRSAVETGYGKAFLTILDSNVTTLIAALFLFQFGTGPIKGFAVTLTIGIIASMFTAIFVTRIVYDYFVLSKKVERISI